MTKLKPTQFGRLGKDLSSKQLDAITQMTQGLSFSSNENGPCVFTKIVHSQGLTFPVTIGMVEVNPALASSLLTKTSGKNRSIFQAHQNRLADSMDNNDFVFTGDTIKMDHEGNVIDGQHRLSTIAKSGENHEMLFVCGLPDNFFIYLDQNKARDLSTTLKGMGVTNTHYHSSFLNILSSASKSMSWKSLVSGKMNNTTGARLYLAHCADIQRPQDLNIVNEIVRVSASAGQKLKLTPTGVALAMYVMLIETSNDHKLMEGREEVFTFIDMIKTGQTGHDKFGKLESLDINNHPVNRVRTAFEKLRTASVSSLKESEAWLIRKGWVSQNGKPLEAHKNPAIVAGYILCAWDRYQLGRTMTKWTYDAPALETEWTRIQERVRTMLIVSLEYQNIKIPEKFHGLGEEKNG